MNILRRLTIRRAGWLTLCYYLANWRVRYISEFIPAETIPVRIVSAKTFQRLIGWIIKQPCWSSLRWKSLT